jgi:hypothetical protein
MGKWETEKMGKWENGKMGKWENGKLKIGYGYKICEKIQ